MTNMITIDELAEKLKVPKSWIYNRTRPSAENPIPCHKVGKYLRFVPDEVAKHLGIPSGMYRDMPETSECATEGA